MITASEFGRSAAGQKKLSLLKTTCRLMGRRIKVADPRIYLASAAYMHIREEVVDEYQTIT